MGGSSGKTFHEGKCLDFAASRLGAFAVTGRYHKDGKHKLSDKYILTDQVLGTGYSGSVYKARVKETADLNTCHCNKCKKDFPVFRESKASDKDVPLADNLFDEALDHASKKLAPSDLATSNADVARVAETWIQIFAELQDLSSKAQALIRQLRMNCRRDSDEDNRKFCARILKARQYLESRGQGCTVPEPVECPACRVRVYPGRLVPTGTLYAVKDLRLEDLNAAKLEEVEAECELWLAMDHPHVGRLADVYQTKEKLSLVSECMEGGELFDRIKTRGVFSEEDAADSAYQMLLALNYIHSHQIVHRDVKLENFLLDKVDCDHIKLIDFGFSKVWEPSVKMNVFCGTLNYCAPEVIQREYSGCQCDMWSFGVTVFVLLLGYYPFNGSSTQATCRKIVAADFAQTPAYDKLSLHAGDFIRKLLVVRPEERLTAEKALQHPFIRQRRQSQQLSLSYGVQSKLKLVYESPAGVPQGKVDTTIAQALVDFAEASKFKRMCLSSLAWTLTNDDRVLLQDAFLEMDTANIGTIRLADFKKVLQDNFQLPDDHVVALFDRLNSSSTEEIHYTDFLAAMVKSKIHVNQDLLRGAFSKFDTDGTGCIQAKDLKLLLGDSIKDDEADGLLAQANVDKDGKLSYEDFIDYVLGDADGDDPVLTTHRKRALQVGHLLVDQEISRKFSFDMCRVDCEVPDYCGGYFFSPFKCFRN